MTKRGKLIVFEGIDGSGKSTLAKELESIFISNVKKSYLTCQPSIDTPLGWTIRHILLKTELTDFAKLNLFLADRNIHVNNVIKPMLDKGINVICDRYFISTLAYQVYYPALVNKKTITNTEYYYRQNLLACENIQPDIIVYCKPDLEKAKANLKSRSLTDKIESIIDVETIQKSYDLVMSFYKTQNGNANIKTLHTLSYSLEDSVNQLEKMFFKDGGLIG